MSRYIDADALKKRIMNNWYTATEISDDIDAEPTADVEKVVRCKDCMHRPYKIPAKYDSSGKCIKYAYITSPDDMCPYVCEDPWYNLVPEDNFFCGFGE